jgi:hypothetical protein
MSAQFPTVPALPGVPVLARLGTPAQVAAGATIAGLTQALSTQLNLPTTITFGTSTFASGLGLQSLSGSPTTPQPDNPNPFIPGPLPAYGITAVGGTVTVESSEGFDAGPTGTQVGTFNSTAVITPDSVFEFEVNADSNINTHPVELGGFQAFNRVQEPITIRMLLACQGQNMSRDAFVSTLKSLREGTQVVTISSPDGSYPNMTLKRWDYTKKAEKGAVTIYANTMWQEERSTNVSISAPPTAMPQGAATTSIGALQPITPTAQQMAAIDGSSSVILPEPLPFSYSSTAPPSGLAF